jgi:hypothetical protein
MTPSQTTVYKKDYMKVSSERKNIKSEYTVAIGKLKLYHRSGMIDTFSRHCKDQ